VLAYFGTFETPKCGEKTVPMIWAKNLAVLNWGIAEKLKEKSIDFCERTITLLADLKSLKFKIS